MFYYMVTLKHKKSKEIICFNLTDSVLDYFLSTITEEFQLIGYVPISYIKGAPRSKARALYL